MVDRLDKLVVLLLRTSGMRDTVLAYKEETGASHTEATTAVRKLARQNGLDHRARAIRKVGAALATAVIIGVAGLLVTAWSK